MNGDMAVHDSLEDFPGGTPRTALPARHPQEVHGHVDLVQKAAWDQLWMLLLAEPTTREAGGAGEPEREETP